MLQHLGPQFKEMIPWGFLLKDRLLYQKSYASLLWMVQKSQRKQCRLLWYQTCFFFASFPRISERIFSNLFSDYWRQSIFFYILDQSTFFRTVEYYTAGVDQLQFSPDYFRFNYKPTTLMLPYSNFHLRTSSTIYLTLWFSVLNFQIRFYNDYVKSHDYLNNNRYLARRWRFQQRLFRNRLRWRRKPIYRMLFWKQSVALRYRAVDFHAIELWRQPQLAHVFSPVDFHTFLPLAHSWRSQLALASRDLPLGPLLTDQQKYLFRMNVVQLNLWANHILAQEPLSYWGLVRMDWTHFLLSLPVFVFTRRFRRFLRQLVDRLRNRFVNRLYIEQRRSALNFPLLSAVRSSSKPLLSSRRFYFVWWTLECRISRFWNSELLDRFCRIRTFNNSRTRAIMFRLNYVIYNTILLQDEVLKKDAVFSNFLKISPFFLHNLLPLDLLFWRIHSNQESYRRFMATGALPLTAFYQKLTLDSYANYRYQTARLLLEYFLRTNGFYFNRGIAWRGADNAWSLRKPFYRLANGDYESHEPRWSIARHMYTAAAVKFILACFRRSAPLSFTSFFLFFDGADVYPGADRMRRSFKTLLPMVWAYRRHYTIYKKGFLREFRRYPNHVYIASRRDPYYRACWFSFSDRMRRAGIKKSDLPYYPQDDELDMIRELKQRSANAKWAKPPIYWIIR